MVNIAIEVPDDVARQLAPAGENLSQRVLEALAIEGYRSGEITSAQVQQMLGLASRWEVDALLKRAQAYLDYTEDDLEADVRAIRRATSG